MYQLKVFGVNAQAVAAGLAHQGFGWDFPEKRDITGIISTHGARHSSILDHTVAILLSADVPLLENARLDWWLAAYAAIILSFLGAVHWGVALGMQDTLTESELGKLLLFSVVPSVLAWFALLLPIKIALWVLASLIVLAYLVDSRLLFNKLAADYGKMRLHLTVIVALLLVAAGFAVP